MARKEPQRQRLLSGLVGSSGAAMKARPMTPRIRGEPRHDTYSGGGTLCAGDENEQTTALFNAVFNV
ncbi:hypothetical protein [Epibacterium ulvae]|uniref:hypothetical protein n=1 Tax=Epibacterium ulvae TaxID=1156985 RepID=UPI002490ED14|nr:hypothetical protein [Epibacterium ulvae]